MRMFRGFAMLAVAACMMIAPAAVSASPGVGVIHDVVASTNDMQNRLDILQVALVPETRAVNDNRADKVGRAQMLRQRAATLNVTNRSIASTPAPLEVGATIAGSVLTQG